MDDVRDDAFTPKTDSAAALFGDRRPRGRPPNSGMVTFYVHSSMNLVNILTLGPSCTLFILSSLIHNAGFPVD